MRLVTAAVVVLSLAACEFPSLSTERDAGPAAVGAKDLGPAKNPPPVRLPHAPTPALPDLPALGQQQQPSGGVGEGSSSDQPCHGVWTGSSAAPIFCAKALLFGADNGSGATVLVPRKLLSRSPDRLPAVVDHRLEGTEGPLRNQGTVPACTAFATATALDHALARWSGAGTPVSVMQIWSRYHSPYVETSLTSNVGQPIGPEQQWPFNASEATQWVPCSQFSQPPRVGCGRGVDAAHVQRLSANPIGEFTEVEYIRGADIVTLQTKIAAGQDVIVTMELPSSFVPQGRPGARYIPHYTRSGGPDAGHALVLAGYAHFSHGSYFLAHNSWGPGWGDGGYAWIHEATLGAWAKELVAVDAEPVVREPGSRPRRTRGETTCAADLVPDSITGACTSPCPDHSPRHDGVCAVAGQCSSPAYVNLTGACVLAAPTVSGKDPATGITWSCGPGGCSYVIPRSSDPSCTGSFCKAACPAPDFHISKMGKSLVCVE